MSDHHVVYSTVLSTLSSSFSAYFKTIDTWGAVICSLGHGRKHMLTILPTIWRPGFKVCSLLEWCFIISIDTCWDWLQRTYILITAQKNL